MCRYSIKMWHGEPETGILIARPIVEADSQLNAFIKFLLPAVTLVEAEWETFSFKVERLD